MIPAFEPDSWYLPKGIHVANLDEIEQRFVVEAPFDTDRARVFSAFRLWVDLVRAILPDVKFWIDGGFVTHKPWAAPSDVDVTFLAKPADLEALSPTQKSQVEALLTKSDGTKAMSGNVDAYLITRGDVPRVLYWREAWSGVIDENRELIPDARKGFLEVRS